MKAFNKFLLIIPAAMLIFAYTLRAPYQTVTGVRADTVVLSRARELEGLWEARRIFGPDIRGTLDIKNTKAKWSAEIAGYSVMAQAEGDSISFVLPGEKGTFRGAIIAGRNKITGYWKQPATITEGVLVSPVTLTKNAAGIWQGDITPYEDEMTCYLMLKLMPDGSLKAFLRNPERNIGKTQYPVDHIERDGEALRFYSARKDTMPGRLLAEGRYDSINDVLSVYLPNRGGTFDFSRVAQDEFCYFYPRGRPTVKYVYSKPIDCNDGWRTARLKNEGISEDSIVKFIQMIIDTPIDSVRSQEDHGILIARHGKLVLEEYFHGESRDKTHTTRSAGKSVASELMGAAIFDGVSVSPGDFVYKVMNGGEFPPGLEQRKRSLTVEHLLTMTSGFDCDENDPNTPGFEDNMWDQTAQPDFYKWTMDLNMTRNPGEKPVYCSANANLVGGVVSRAANETTLALFQKLIAGPLGIKHYQLPVSPDGDFTLTGSSRFVLRDFIKFAQLHLNGGTWNGRRIYTSEWSDKATSPLEHFPGGSFDYGYLWWSIEYPYKGRVIRAYFAAGNGGQIAMAIPELDLALACFTGNYNDSGGRTFQNVYVPKYILPAVEEDK